MIRTATLADRPHFLRLWAEFMAEQEKEGSYILATTRNLYRMLENFESYVTGGTDGVCMFWEAEGQPVAIVLTGYCSGAEEWETSLGRIATLWGVYVQPSYRGKGIALKLFAHGVEVGKELGFDTLETHVRSDNTHGLRTA
jgi:ribosomal protein S18 acetylase RimI-like enzyme